MPAQRHSIVRTGCISFFRALSRAQANADATDAANNDKQQADAAAMQQTTGDLIAAAQAAAADTEARANEVEQAMTADEMAKQDAARALADAQSQVRSRKIKSPIHS